MKLGFISAILENSSFEEVIDIAADMGYECVEVACWPKEISSRRYAGVTHIDIEQLNKDKIAYIKEYCAKKNVEISALAYYPNTLSDNMAERTKAVEHLKAMIYAAPPTGSRYNHHIYRSCTDFIGGGKLADMPGGMEANPGACRALSGKNRN